MKKKRPQPGEDETLDSFYHGRIRVIQKKKGYRFSVDAPLLADFIQTKESDELLELGAGSGIISLLLSFKPCRHITCLEIQKGLVDLACRNVRLNGLVDKITVLHKDLRKFLPDKKFDVIFSNPPYIKGKSGDLSRSEEKSIAKHEIEGDIFDIMRLVGRLLKKDGRAFFIYPAKRKQDFVSASELSGLRLAAFRPVFTRKGDAARWFLAECDFASDRSAELPPLFLYDENGEYTSDVKKIFAGEGRGSNS